MVKQTMPAYRVHLSEAFKIRQVEFFQEDAKISYIMKHPALDCSIPISSTVQAGHYENKHYSNFPILISNAKPP